MAPSFERERAVPQFLGKVNMRIMPQDLPQARPPILADGKVQVKGAEIVRPT